MGWDFGFLGALVCLFLPMHSWISHVLGSPLSGAYSGLPIYLSKKIVVSRLIGYNTKFS